MALRDFIASTSLAKGLGVDVLLKDGGVGTQAAHRDRNRVVRDAMAVARSQIFAPSNARSLFVAEEKQKQGHKAGCGIFSTKHLLRLTLDSLPVLLIPGFLSSCLRAVQTDDPEYLSEYARPESRIYQVNMSIRVVLALARACHSPTFFMWLTPRTTAF